jgi:hypothetical protein
MRRPASPAQNRTHTQQRVVASLQVVRHQLAIAMIALFAVVCLGVIFAPDATVFERLMPFVAAPLTLVLSHYFGRRGRG